METIDLRQGRRTLTDLAYQHILNSILSQHLKPGARLSPEDLASAMGISPTPVKYALSRLSGEGLVEYRHGRGPFVTILTKDDVLELYGSRLMCELYAIQEGFRSIDEQFLAKARELLSGWDASFSSSRDPSEAQIAMAEHDCQFHIHLLSLLHNSRTIAWGRQLNVHLKSARVRVILEMGGTYLRSEAVRQEHLCILDALERGDPVGAAAAVRSHVAASQVVMRSFFEAKAERLEARSS